MPNKIVCPCCDGYGWVLRWDGQGEQICPKCHGEGKVSAPAEQVHDHELHRFEDDGNPNHQD